MKILLLLILLLPISVFALITHAHINGGYYKLMHGDIVMFSETKPKSSHDNPLKSLVCRGTDSTFKTKNWAKWYFEVDDYAYASQEIVNWQIKTNDYYPIRWFYTSLVVKAGYAPDQYIGTPYIYVRCDTIE